MNSVGPFQPQPIYDSVIPCFVSILDHKSHFLGYPSYWRGIKNKHIQSCLIFLLLIPLKKRKKIF